MASAVPTRSTWGGDTEDYQYGWSSLPADSLAAVVSCGVLTQHEVGAVRLVCHPWCQAVTSTLSHLTPRCQTREQLDQLPTRFPLLTHLDLHKFDHALLNHTLLYHDSQQLLAGLADQLCCLPSLSQLTFSAECAMEMGRKSWAAWMAASVTTPAFLRKRSTPSRSKSTTPPNSGTDAWASGSTVQNTTAPRVSGDTCSCTANSAAGVNDHKGKSKLKGAASMPPVTHDPPDQSVLPIGPVDNRPSGTDDGAQQHQSQQDEGCSHTTAGPSAKAAARCGKGGEDVDHLSWPELLWLGENCQHPKNWDTSILWMPLWLSELKELRALSVCPHDDSTHGPKSSLLHLPTATISRLTSINLSGCSLSHLPETLLSASQLKALLLRGCSLETLASGISQLTQLTRLDLSENKLKKLPSKLSQLTALKELLASRNMLSHIPPAAFAGLSHLSHLDLSNNQLPEPPAGLRECRRLQRLRLSHNWLKGLSTNGVELCCVGGLSNLEVVNVSDVSNPLALPAEVVLLSNLKALDLSDNIVSLAALQRLEDLTTLTRLMLHAVKVDGPCPHLLKDIPIQVSKLTSLKHVVASGNAIHSLPSFLSCMTQLQYLDVSSNGISNDDMARCLDVASCIPQLRTLKLMGSSDLLAPGDSIQADSALVTEPESLLRLSLECGDFWLRRGVRVCKTACLNDVDSNELHPSQGME